MQEGTTDSYQGSKTLTLGMFHALGFDVITQTTWRKVMQRTFQAYEHAKLILSRIPVKFVK